MPDIDPAALSRASISSSTPILPPKALSIVPLSSIPVSKPVKSDKIPPRIDLEPLYNALKNSIGEEWSRYCEAVRMYAMGMFFLFSFAPAVPGQVDFTRFRLVRRKLLST